MHAWALALHVKGTLAGIFADSSFSSPFLAPPPFIISFLSTCAWNNSCAQPASGSRLWRSKISVCGVAKLA